MNLPIVDFETTKEVEEFGFNWKCDYHYDKHGDLDGHGRPDKLDITYAPYQSEVVKWFRDEHDIYIEPSINLEEKYDNVVVVDYNAEVKENYSTYEAAELAGIKKAIEILKERS